MDNVFFPDSPVNAEFLQGSLEIHEGLAVLLDVASSSFFCGSLTVSDTILCLHQQ